MGQLLPGPHLGGLCDVTTLKILKRTAVATVSAEVCILGDVWRGIFFFGDFALFAFERGLWLCRCRRRLTRSDASLWYCALLATQVVDLELLGGDESL